MTHELLLDLISGHQIVKYHWQHGCSTIVTTFQFTTLKIRYRTGAKFQISANFRGRIQCFFSPPDCKIPKFPQRRNSNSKIFPLRAAWTTMESLCTPKLILAACKRPTVLQVCACDNTVKHYAISICLVPVTPQNNVEASNLPMFSESFHVR